VAVGADPDLQQRGVQQRGAAEVDGAPWGGTCSSAALCRDALRCAGRGQGAGGRGRRPTSWVVRYKVLSPAATRSTKSPNRMARFWPLPKPSCAPDLNSTCTAAPPCSAAGGGLRWVGCSGARRSLAPRTALGLPADPPPSP
jgi:hypothetical protein